jgi:hypothetical protein
MLLAAVLDVTEKSKAAPVVARLREDPRSASGARSLRQRRPLGLTRDRYAALLPGR